MATGRWSSGFGSSLLGIWNSEVSTVTLLTFWLKDWPRARLLDISE